MFNLSHLLLALSVGIGGWITTHAHPLQRKDNIVSPKLGEIDDSVYNPKSQGAGYDVPNYIIVSPDFVALAPSGPSGLNSNGVNNMICLANRYRYDQGLPPLALDAELVKFAQARAEYLDKLKAEIKDNAIAGVPDDPTFNKDVWKNVTQNMIKTTNNPTYAQWEIQNNKLMLQNFKSKNNVYFGCGKQGDYYVQVFGIPVKNGTVDQKILQHCPSNETFHDWVFPNGEPIPRKDKNQVTGKSFPYKAFAKLSPKLLETKDIYFDSGRTNSTKYYFTPSMGTVPYLKDLSIPNTTAPETAKVPYAAIAGSGELGMTKDEINLMTCLINARRYEACLPPLALHPSLIASAQAHSYENNRNLNMSHYSSMGPLGYMIKRRGYDYHYFAENIVANTHDVFRGHVTFSQSQGHLDNMLGTKYVHVGAGRSGQFWTVHFGNLLTPDGLDPKTVPLCPGNKTSVEIAFPKGLPKEAKFDTTACGATKATSVPTPPYIQSMDGHNPTPTPPNSGDPSSADVPPGGSMSPPIVFKPPPFTCGGSNKDPNVVYTVTTSTVTSYVDPGDPRLNPPTTTSGGDKPSSSDDDGDYSLTILGIYDIDILVTPT